MVMPVMRMAVLVAVMVTVMMISAAAQEPRARDIHGQAETGNRDCLGKVDWDRRENTADEFVADQHAQSLQG